MNATQFLINQKAVSSDDKAGFIDALIKAINNHSNLNDLQEEFVLGVLDLVDYFLSSQNPNEVLVITLNLATYINSCRNE